MNQNWSPSETDFISASKHYVDYATGLNMFCRPQAMSELLGYVSLEGDNLNHFTTSAEELMLSGLRGVITYANNPGFRANLISMEGLFEFANPNQLALQEYALDKCGDHLDQINPGIKVFKPLPTADRVIYDYICHSRLAKIPTRRLIQPFRSDSILDDILEDRTLATSRAKKRAKS